MMIAKMMMLTGLALIAVTSTAAQPAPQSDVNGTMQGNAMSSDPAQNSTMPSNDMNGSTMAMPKMSRSDMTAMKRCRAMSSSAMAKSARCTRLMQKYPNSSGS